jgi:hypothetical protein
VTVEAKASTQDSVVNVSGRLDRSPAGVVVPAAAAAGYALVTIITEPVFVADTPDMAVSALGHVLGQDCTYLEPGHLLWRPAGAVMLQAFNTVQPGERADAVLRASEVQLGWFAWVAGLVTIVSCATWVQRRIGNTAATAFGIGLVLFSKAFINYAQVGASYMPALAFLMIAVLLVCDEDVSPIRAILGGVSAGLSVLFWGTFAVALPAVIAAPFIFGRDARLSPRNSTLICAGGAIVALAASLWVYRSLQLSSAGELAAWVSTADHGIATGGVPRAVIGFARSFLETGDYGRLVKRFLIGDPTDRVPVKALFGFPMIGIVGFYLGLLFMLFLAWRHRRRVQSLAFFACNAIPVLAFAVFWQGGDLERYLALVPGIALLGATAFAAAPPVARWVLGSFLAMIIVPNALSLGRPAVLAERDRLRLTTLDVESPSRPLVVFTHWQDERVQFHRNYPPGAQPLQFRPYNLLTPGNSSVINWREELSRRIATAWNAGIDVYITERLLTETPKPEWNWVEGDDERVSWKDFYQFFMGFTFDSATVGRVAGDGFRRLPPTPENLALLSGFSPAPRPSAPKDPATAGPVATGRCAVPSVIPDLASLRR